MNLAEAASGGAGAGNGTFLLIFMALAIVAMFFMSRRARKRQAEATAFRTTLEPGQRVMTTSGMFGTVVHVDDDKITIASISGQESEWLLAAIAKLVEDEHDATGEESADVDDAETTEDEALPPTDVGTNPTFPPRDDTTR